ncbi:MAG: type II 3-dehydroquinate dehydratase [Desulfovermiculus sp.]|nr:type II 3-dehydroquinate dehydratase [Desulfovermiculus sp.]
MSTYSFLILNGPNLGHLGRRQPQIYGHQSMDELPDMISACLGPDRANRVAWEADHKNGEGALIDRLEQAWKDSKNGIVLNAGAYTHTSLALADCLAWIKIPCVEVHLSNVWARAEGIRHQSLIAPSCLGVIAGFGLMGYAMAVLALVEHLDKNA